MVQRLMLPEWFRQQESSPIRQTAYHSIARQYSASGGLRDPAQLLEPAAPYSDRWASVLLDFVDLAWPDLYNGLNMGLQ